MESLAEQSIKNIIFFVDFDNMDVDASGNEVQDRIEEYVVQVISHIVNEETDRKLQFHINVRFYGGWYNEENTRTPKAEQLAEEIDRDFPLRDPKYKYTISAEIAESLLSIPNSIITRTYRVRQSLNGLRVCKTPCCSSSEKYIQYFKDLKKKKKCQFCNTKSTQILWHNEQKLVDIMLTSDLVFTTSDSEYSEFVIVTSDEDFLPIIFQIAFQGKRIFHAQAKTGRTIHKEYQRISPERNYIELRLEE